MASSWYSIVVDARDPIRLAHWWAEVIGYEVVFESPDEAAIARDHETYPGMVFVPVPEDKSLKNRIHIDLNPDNQEAEVHRLEGMGARRVEVGQSQRRPPASWVVMADPEGNEFCVLTARSN
ncbi:MAG: VOC family protein [Streptomyces sp.]|jgi:predicted enzyme related to lactoylglutathione lyase|nr:VOC family protein [Streptomyces sp.]